MFKFIDLIKNMKGSDKVNFEDIAIKWLAQKKIIIKQSTYAKYLQTINKHLLPTLKEMTISDLEKYNYTNLVSELMEDLSAKTVKDIVCILKSILSYINEEYNCNIKIKRIISPKLQNENVAVMSHKEKGRLESYCLKNKTLKSLGIVICLNTGMRIGEICSLKWKNIDLEKRLIFVKTTMQRIKDDKTNKTKVIIDKPKTAKSIRAIPISNKLYEILLPLKRKYKDEDFFLTGDSKKYIEPRIYQFAFKRILKKCRIKPYKFHTLRHTMATNCIEVGMDIKSLSEILGHSSVKITLDKYVHSNFKTQKKYLEKL